MRGRLENEVASAPKRPRLSSAGGSTTKKKISWRRLSEADAQQAFRKLEEDMETILDRAQPPLNLAYCSKGEQEAASSQMQAFEKRVCDNMIQLAVNMKEAVDKYPELSRAVDKSGMPLIGKLLTEVTGEYDFDNLKLKGNAFDSNRNDAKKKRLDLITYLIAQNNSVLHYPMREKSKNYVLDYIEDWELLKWLAEHCSMTAFGNSESVRRGRHVQVALTALRQGDFDFMKRFYTGFYPQGISQVDQGRNTLLYHLASQITIRHSAIVSNGGDEILAWAVRQYPAAALLQNSRGEAILGILSTRLSNEIWLQQRFQMPRQTRRRGDDRDGQEDTTDTSNIPWLLRSIHFFVTHFPHAVRIPLNYSHRGRNNLPLHVLLNSDCQRNEEVRNLTILILRAHYPNIPTVVSYSSFVDAIHKCLDKEAIYAKMSIQLALSTMVLEKKAATVPPKSLMAELSEAYSSWATGRLQETTAKIQSIRDVDIEQAKQRFLGRN
jgi:uncharacterized protein YutD